MVSYFLGSSSVIQKEFAYHVRRYCRYLYISSNFHALLASKTFLSKALLYDSLSYLSTVYVSIQSSKILIYTSSLSNYWQVKSCLNNSAFPLIT